MREHDMRRRVEQFLQRRLRTVLVPATLGLGLALGGCDGEGLLAEDGGAKEDATAEVPVYSAALPDAGPDLGNAQPEYMAQQLPDSGPSVRYAAQMADAGEPVAVYMAPRPNT
jgi:hypothetical protein